jgi:hypothetical protein
MSVRIAPQMLHPLRIPRKRRAADRAAQFLIPRHEIGSRPQPVARRALHLVRGLIAETRQFVGHALFSFRSAKLSATSDSSIDRSQIAVPIRYFPPET